MENKQTPIDYIRDNLFYPIQLNQLKRVLSEAEQMHKEQIKTAYLDGRYHPMTSEDYYNETYGK